jgi:hypothetical protein
MAEPTDVSSEAGRDYRRDDALPRILAFVRKFGPDYAALCMHAAVPLGLSSELLHLIRYNFVPSAPAIAEADLLLCSLCSEVGAGYFQMDRGVRDVLIGELQSEPRLGSARLHDVADMLLAFVERERSTRHDPETASFQLAQEWTALSFTQPAEAAEALAAALSGGLQSGETADVMRIVNITQSLSNSLYAHEEVVLYATGIERLCSGDITVAARFFEAIGDSAKPTQIGKVRLPPPVELIKSHRRRPEMAETSTAQGVSASEEPVLDREDIDGRHSSFGTGVSAIGEHGKGQSDVADARAPTARNATDATSQTSSKSAARPANARGRVCVENGSAEKASAAEPRSRVA